MATLDSLMVTFLTQPSTFLSIEMEIFPRLLFWGRDFYKSSCLHWQVRCEVRKNLLQDIWSFSIFFFDFSFIHGEKEARPLPIMPS